MFRKLLAFSAVFVLIIAVSNITYASVEGTWNVEGKLTVTIKAEGYPKFKEKFDAYGDFFFGGSDKGGPFEINHTIEMEEKIITMEMFGHWNQTKKKFKVYIDQSEAESFLKTVLDEYADNPDVNIKKIVFNGKERKKGKMIKGKMFIKLDVDLYIEQFGRDVEAKVKAVYKFKGTRKP